MIRARGPRWGERLRRENRRPDGGVFYGGDVKREVEGIVDGKRSQAAVGKPARKKVGQIELRGGKVRGFCSGGR